MLSHADYQSMIVRALENKVELHVHEAVLQHDEGDQAWTAIDKGGKSFKAETAPEALALLAKYHGDRYGVSGPDADELPPHQPSFSPDPAPKAAVGPKSLEDGIIDAD